MPPLPGVFYTFGRKSRIKCGVWTLASGVYGTPVFRRFGPGDEMPCISIY
jgi:hypothetical protein